MTPHPLTKFEIKACYQNETRFNGASSRDNLPHKIKYGANVLNLDECSHIGTHWIGLYANNKTVTYFESFENIIFRIQAYDSVMRGYFCIGFINYMFTAKSLTAYTNLFSPNNFKKNDDIILNYFLTNLQNG